MPTHRPPSISPKTARHVTYAGNATRFSYHAQRHEATDRTGRQPLAAHPLATVKRRFRLNRMLRLGVLVFVGIMVGAVCLLLDSTPAVTVAAHSPPHMLQPLTVYQRAATSLLQKTLTGRIKPLVDTADVSRHLLHQFPELAAASLTLPLMGHEPTLTLTAATPVLRLTSANQTTVVDISGFAVAAANHAPWSSLHVFSLRDDSGTALTVGAPALPASSVRFVQTVAQQLALAHVAAQSYVLTGGGSEIDVIMADTPYRVRFNLVDDTTALQQTGTYLALRHSLQGRSIVPSEYIDVRINGRAYYK